jgi:hypothetical protein
LPPDRSGDHVPFVFGVRVKVTSASPAETKASL